MSESIEDRLSDIEAKLDRLVTFVDTVTSGMTAAREAPGMTGMMARNMLPNMTQSVPGPHHLGV